MDIALARLSAHKATTQSMREQESFWAASPHCRSDGPSVGGGRKPFSLRDLTQDNGVLSESYINCCPQICCIAVSLKIPDTSFKNVIYF